MKKANLIRRDDFFRMAKAADVWTWADFGLITWVVMILIAKLEEFHSNHPTELLQIRPPTLLKGMRTLLLHEDLKYWREKRPFEARIAGDLLRSMEVAEFWTVMNRFWSILLDLIKL